MLGPQVSFMESEFKEITNKPVVIIPPQFYAMAKSEEILEIAIKKLGGK
jgi:cellobiose-specific phosphotransferase system component IIB